MDGVTFSMRITKSIERVPVLVVTGVTQEVQKKVLEFQCGDKKSAATWRELSQKVMDFIRGPITVANLIVTIPEALGVRQTERILTEFRENGLDVMAMVVNHVIENADCDFHRRRQAMQRKYWGILKERFGLEFPVIATPLSAEEIKGIDRIRAFGTILFETGSVW